MIVFDMHSLGSPYRALQRIEAYLRGGRGEGREIRREEEKREGRMERILLTLLSSTLSQMRSSWPMWS